jgi:hypothetical protein
MAMSDESTDAQLADYGNPAPANPADEPRRKLGFTALEIAEQVCVVQDWLAEGVRPNIIRQRCAARWGLATRTAEYRLQAARRQAIADINTMDRAEKVAEMLEKLETVIQQSIDRNMGANAIGAMKLQADLLQLVQRNKG